MSHEQVNTNRVPVSLPASLFPSPSLFPSRKRMSKYGLTVHPEKTRLVRFEPSQAPDSETEDRDSPIRRHSTFWDLPTTGADPCEANGWSNGKRRETDSSERLQRCRNGAERTFTFRSRSNIRSSRQSCEATTGTTGLLETSTASRNFGRACEGFGDVGYLGDAETAQ
jgi:hypothetical protein